MFGRTDTQVGEKFLRNHKQCFFICLDQERNRQNCLEKNWCYLSKGLNNLAICNNRDMKETPENTNVFFPAS